MRAEVCARRCLRAKLGRPLGRCCRRGRTTPKSNKETDCSAAWPWFGEHPREQNIPESTSGRRFLWRKNVWCGLKWIPLARTSHQPPCQRFIFGLQGRLLIRQAQRLSFDFRAKAMRACWRLFHDAGCGRGPSGTTTASAMPPKASKAASNSPMACGACGGAASCSKAAASRNKSPSILPKRLRTCTHQ